MDTFGAIAHGLTYTVVFFAVGGFVTVVTESLVGSLAPGLGMLVGLWVVGKLPF